MLVYLDNGENIKKHPNENFGRELLELFTMGVGNYTERDVREAARAFTGWTNDVLRVQVRRRPARLRRRRRSSARPDPFNGEDIIDIILKQPVTAEFVSAKLYRYLRARGGRRRRSGAALGRTFRDSGYQMKPLLEADLPVEGLLQPACGTRRRSRAPCQLVVSTYRKMGLREVPTIPDFGRMTARARPVAVRSAERRGLGRRTHLDHAVHAAAARQPVPRRAVSRRQGLPPARSLDVGHRPRRRRAARARHGHHRGDQGKRRGAANMMAESNMMVDRDEDYNTRYGGYKGNLIAFERTKPIPRRPAAIDLTAMIKAAGADTADKVVDHFVAPISVGAARGQGSRRRSSTFLRGKLGTTAIQPGEKLEESLRELLYLVLSTPEYQLG